MSISWYSNLQVPDGIAAAVSLQRPILVDFWSPTCRGCAKLVALTYQDENVQRYLAESFVCIKYNTTQPDNNFRKLNGPFAHLWHPDLVVFDHHLKEMRRVIGFLPPAEFIAQVAIGEALVHLYQGRKEAALALAENVADRPVSAEAAAEALYWAGVAAYRTRGSLADLALRWNLLSSRFPASTWSLRADCLDVEIPVEGFDDADPRSVRLVESSIG